MTQRWNKSNLAQRALQTAALWLIWGHHNYALGTEIGSDLTVLRGADCHAFCPLMYHITDICPWECQKATVSTPRTSKKTASLSYTHAAGQSVSHQGNNHTRAIAKAWMNLQEPHYAAVWIEICYKQRHHATNP